jgi:hypothetical protein
MIVAIIALSLSNAILLSLIVWVGREAVKKLKKDNPDWPITK